MNKTKSFNKKHKIRRLMKNMEPKTANLGTAQRRKRNLKKPYLDFYKVLGRLQTQWKKHNVHKTATPYIL